MRQIYIPPGHDGLIEAAKTLARRLFPERWSAERIPAWEADIWDRLGRVGGYRPELIDQHLLIYAEKHGARGQGDYVDRYADFRDAQRLLWQALGEGSVVAQYTDDDGSLVTVDTQIWRAKNGLEHVQTGRATIKLPGCFLTTFPWVPMDKVTRLASSTSDTVRKEVGGNPLQIPAASNRGAKT